MAPYHSVEDWSYTEDGNVVKVRIATTDDDAYPSGWRYALHYGTVDGETVLRYDNAHEDTKGHEKHAGGPSRKSTFQGCWRCTSGSSRRSGKISTISRGDRGGCHQTEHV